MATTVAATWRRSAPPQPQRVYSVAVTSSPRPAAGCLPHGVPATTPGITVVIARQGSVGGGESSYRVLHLLISHAGYA